MRICFLMLLASICGAQEITSQPPIWNTRPDAAAFEKLENDRLATAQRSVDQIVAAQGTRTIGNTLQPYDEAIRQLNAASYFANLMQQVHPDAKFRDRATEATRKVSAAATALS